MVSREFKSMENKNLIFQVSESDFVDKVIEKSEDKIILVDFWAPWCAPCLSIAPALEELAQEYKGKVTIAKMNVDENANTPVTYGVRSIPYMVMFKDGKIFDSVVGAVPKSKLSDLMDKAVD